MRNSHLVAAILSVLCLQCAVWAADAAQLRDQVWGSYLDPQERAALTALLPPPAGPQAQQLNAADPTAVANVRQGFFAIVDALAPPLPGLAGVPFEENGVSGLWFTPGDADTNRVLLYFHGGGYMVGSAATAASVAGFLADEAEIGAFALDYPLAPESPYPAQLDSAHAAYLMLLAKGFAPGDIVVAGDSAEGHLALQLLIRLRGENQPLPAAAYLISPWGDITYTSATHTEKLPVEVAATPDLIGMMADASFGGKDRRAAAVSPVFADLRGLPPLLIQAGSFEILLDDSLTLARNAALADVPVKLSVWPGYSHCFQMFHSRLRGAEKALGEAAEFLEEALEGKVLRE